MLLRLRVSLPDRPGALGQVARALGTLGADIHQVTVLERETGRAVDDFTVSWPGPPDPGYLKERLAGVPGVSVEGVWPTRDVPGVGHGYDVLRFVAADPVRAYATLVDALPDMVGADWAATVTDGTEEPGAGGVVHRSVRAPGDFALPSPLPMRPVLTYDGETGLMSVPLARSGLCLMLARAHGPAFHRAELDTVVRLAEVVSLLAVAPAGPATPAEAVIG